MVGHQGLEPATARFQTDHATRLRYSQIFGFFDREPPILNDFSHCRLYAAQTPVSVLLCPFDHCQFSRVYSGFPPTSTALDRIPPATPHSRFHWFGVYYSTDLLNNKAAGLNLKAACLGLNCAVSAVTAGYLECHDWSNLLCSRLAYCSLLDYLFQPFTAAQAA